MALLAPVAVLVVVVGVALVGRNGQVTIGGLRSQTAEPYQR